MAITYAIYQPTWLEKQAKKLGSCISEGDSKEQAISRAINYFETEMQDNDETGTSDQEVTIISYNEKTEKETSKQITLRVTLDNDNYDGGRFDYNNSRLQEDRMTQSKHTPAPWVLSGDLQYVEWLTVRGES